MVEEFVTVLEEYSNSSLVSRLWQTLRYDWWEVFKHEHPTGGRLAYHAHIYECLRAYSGQFYLDNGDEYDPSFIEIDAKTISNFAGKPSDNDVKGSAKAETLRVIHAYLQINYPDFGKSLQINHFASTYALMLRSQHIQTTDPDTLKTYNRIAESMTGIFVTAGLEEIFSPDFEDGPQLDEHHPECDPFINAEKIFIFTTAQAKPILHIRCFTFRRNNSEKLRQGIIDFEAACVGHLAGFAIPSFSSVHRKGRKHMIDIDDATPHYYEMNGDQVAKRMGLAILLHDRHCADIPAHAYIPIKKRMFDAPKKPVDLYGRGVQSIDKTLCDTSAELEIDHKFLKGAQMKGFSLAGGYPYFGEARQRFVRPTNQAVIALGQALARRYGVGV